MKNVLALIIIACLPAVQTNAQETEKYLFDKELPVFVDSMQAELTYPLAWGNSDIRQFDLWRSAARNKLREEMLMPPPPAKDFGMKSAYPLTKSRRDAEKLGEEKIRKSLDK